MPKIPAPSMRVLGMVSVDIVVDVLVWLGSGFDALVFRVKG